MSSARTVERSSGSSTSAAVQRLSSPVRVGLGAIRARSRPALLLVLAALLVGLTVFGFFATRPEEWSSRATLVASAETEGDAAGDSSNLGTIASLTLPGVEAVATSGSVLSTVAREVPGSPDAVTLARTVTVQVVPTSAVVRISVVTGDADTSRAVVLAIAQRVVAADLLAPAGTFSIVDSDPSAVKVAPDLVVGAGFGVVAAILTVAAVVVASVLARPGLGSSATVRRVLDDDSIAVIDLQEAGAEKMVRSLLRPLSPTLVPVGRTDDATLSRIADLLPGTDDPDVVRDDRHVVLVLQRGRVGRTDLQTAVHLTSRAGWELDALLLT